MLLRRSPITVILFAAARLAGAQDWEAEARALRPADTSRAQASVLDDLERRARVALERIPRAQTRGDAEKARPGLRRRLEQSLGHLRLPRPDLRATVTGVLARDGYRIEKVVFQSLPDTWVPAHLYLPDTVTGAAPAILFYNGHWWPDSKSRPDFQAFCINMARMGFVVFSFDPFGQGERGVSSRDHRRTETLLAGVSQQGIAEYETRAALDYLLSRKEVDPRRVGMTGASGGGFNTWINAALDDRIAVAVPVVGTSDFLEQIQVTRELDWYAAAEHCHFVPGLIQYANNHELVAMIAPRPLMIIAASVDQSFPAAGVRAVHKYGEALYRSFGAPEKIGFFEDAKEGHGYQKAKREAAYGWFLQWLMHRGDGRPVPEPPTTTLPFDAPELRAFADGAKKPAGPGMIAAVGRLAAASRSTKRVASLMGTPPEPVPANVTLSPSHVQRVMLATQAGIEVPVLVLRPSASEVGTLVAVDDRGKEPLAADPLVKEALRRNWMVWAADPRGIGELALTKPGWAFAVSLLLGENFVWRQAWDIRRVLTLAAETPRSRPVALYARGHNAALAAGYAAAMDGPVPKWTVLREGFPSFRHFYRRPQSLEASYRLMDDDIRAQRKTAFDREIPHEYFVFGALDAEDWPQMLARVKTRTIIADPIDGDWGRLAEDRSTVPVTTIEEWLRAKW